MRSLLVSRSTYFPLVCATLLLAAQATATHAAPSPDAIAIAQAYGELSVFVLNVAAGSDGKSREPAWEQAFVNAFAQPVLAAYPDLSSDEQQALASLPELRDELRQAWPTLPVSQRRQIQQR